MCLFGEKIETQLSNLFLFKLSFYLILNFSLGTIDHGNYLCASAAVDFFLEIGGRDGVLAHVTPLMDWAADMLAASMGTNRMEVPKSMEAPYLRCVGEEFRI